MKKVRSPVEEKGRSGDQNRGTHIRLPVADSHRVSEVALGQHRPALCSREYVRSSVVRSGRGILGGKVRSRPVPAVNLHHGKIEDAVVRAVIQHTDGLKLQVVE